MTSAEVKAIIREHKTDRLHKRVINDCIEHARRYSGKNLQGRLLGYFNDLAKGGCRSGLVGLLACSSDTDKFFRRYRREIIHLVDEYQSSTGEHISNAEWFDSDDPFCEGVHNRNYLAWFAYEAIAFDLYNAIDE